MNRVKLAEDTIKNVTDHVKDIRPDDLQAYYIAAYLPIMVDCLASIADRLQVRVICLHIFQFNLCIRRMFVEAGDCQMKNLRQL